MNNASWIFPNTVALHTYLLPLALTFLLLFQHVAHNNANPPAATPLSSPTLFYATLSNQSLPLWIPPPPVAPATVPHATIQTLPNVDIAQDSGIDVFGSPARDLPPIGGVPAATDTG